MISIANGNKEVTKSRPCVICGKPDYCSRFPAEGGGEMHLCKRNETKENLIGQDGNFYVFSGVSRKGYTVFEDANQRRAKDLAKEGKDKAYEFYANKVPEVKKLTVVDQVKPLSNKELDRVYRTLLSCLSLEPKDREYLRKEGWTDELIDKNHIVSFPEKDFTRFMYRKHNPSKNPYRKKLAKMVMEKMGMDSLRGVPGAYIDSKGDWTFAGPSGILIPLYDVNHLMYRLRIRWDFRDIDAEIHQGLGEDDWFSYGTHPKIYINWSGYYLLNGKEKQYLKEISKNENGRKVVKKVSGKYRNFASYSVNEEEEKKGFLVNSYNSGCEAGNRLGFYYDAQRDDMYILYLIEGEKKGIFCNNALRAPMVSVPGVDSWNLLLEGKTGERPIDVMKEKGTKILVVAYDADKSKNENVLKAESKAVEGLRKEGLILGLASWDIRNGKGMDDLLHNGYRPSYELAN